jgi:putative redox protein
MSAYRLIMDDTERTIVEIGREAFTTRVQAGGHEVTVDEPGELGGGNRGVSPYGMLLGAIGSCVVITVKMYADRKGWALDGVRAELTHERRSPGDETIRMTLTFKGDLDESQRSRLEVIASKCPVKRTVTGDLTVETKVV